MSEGELLRLFMVWYDTSQAVTVLFIPRWFELRSGHVVECPLLVIPCTMQGVTLQLFS